MQTKTDVIVTFYQPSLRRQITWNLTRHEIMTSWKPTPQSTFQDVETMTYTDDVSAWHYLVSLMTVDSARIGPKDWTAV